MSKHKQELMTDEQKRQIADSESDEQFWERMFDVGIAAEVSDEDDAAWRANRGGVADEE